MNSLTAALEAEKIMGPVFVAPNILVVDEGLKLRRDDFTTLDDAYHLLRANREYLAPHFEFVRDYTYDDAWEGCMEDMGQMAEGKLAAYGIFVAGHMVGSVDMSFPASDLGTMNIWLARSSQGLGIATRASERLIAYAFSERTVNRVQMDIAPDNTAARQLAERLGASVMAGQGDDLFETWQVRKNVPGGEGYAR